MPLAGVWELQKAAYNFSTFFLIVLSTKVKDRILLTVIFLYIMTIIGVMARDSKVNMPMGQGGLTRYFDEYKSKIAIKPGHVIVMILIVIFIEIILSMKGNSWLGI